MKNVTLYKFWAPWCGPCRQMSPIVKKVIEQRPEIKLIEVNVEDDSDLVRLFGIKSVPSFVLDSGDKKSVKVGACSEKDLIAFVDENI